ncbi:MAG: Crp/Fnr family transcriptional regulator [Terriglobales bacterium]
MPAPASSAARVPLLRLVPLFADLEDAPLATLAQRATPHHYAAGEVLFEEGDRCAGVFVLTRGSVRVFKISASGRELMLHRETSPATVAEVPLVDGGPYPASVRAEGAVESLFIERKDFLNICLQHPQVAVAALAVFGRKLRILVALAEAVTFGGVRQRLARMLLDQAGSTHKIEATHQELALALGTVREVISRNLSRFQGEGMVHLKPRAIELLDVEALRREAESEL